MALPKLETPTYELSLPSTNESIKFRPFLVKEQKILYMAQNSKNDSEMTNSIGELVKNCTFNKIDPLQSPMFDIEYIFLKLRAKSVGETVEVNLICPDDNKTSVTVSIDIDSIKVKKNRKHKNIIKLDDNLSLKLKYPSLDQFIGSNFESKDDQSISSTLKVITSCIDVIYTEEESWVGSDSTEKELEEFIDQLNTKQFQLIEEFFNTMPKLSHPVKVKNPVTEVESTVVLEGLAAFFS